MRHFPDIRRLTALFTRKRNTLYLYGLMLISLAVMFSVLFVGGSSIELSDITGVLQNAPATTGQRIFWNVRLPRVLLSFVVGATLSMCGMAFQALFRNALATPFTLGLSSGASFGAILAVKMGLDISIFGVSTTHVFAFSGGVLSIALVYGIARLKRHGTTAVMLLSGIAVSLFFNSLILFIQYLADITEAVTILRWLLGGLTVVGYQAVAEVGIISLGGLGVLFYKRSELNLLMTSDEIATGRGIDVEKTRVIIFLAVSMAAGSVISICGPIGFLGLIVPNIMRLVFGSDHFDLAPACFFGGGVFLVICDTLARSLIYPAEIPVGVILSLLGGPFFIWVLFRSKNI